MQKSHTTIAALATTGLLLAGSIGPASAKLPIPSPEAKAKSDEAKAKTEFSDKVAAYKLCLAQDRVAATYRQSRSVAGTVVAAPEGLPACKDPGSYEAAQAAAKVGIADALPLNNEPVKK